MTQPIFAFAPDLSARWSYILVWDCQTANDAPSRFRDERAPFINEHPHDETLFSVGFNRTRTALDPQPGHCNRISRRATGKFLPRVTTKLSISNSADPR